MASLKGVTRDTIRSIAARRVAAESVNDLLAYKGQMVTVYWNARDIGYGEESGVTTGIIGDVDWTGKIEITTPPGGGDETVYLFPDEIESIEPAQQGVLPGTARRHAMRRVTVYYVEGDKASPVVSFDHAGDDSTLCRVAHEMLNIGATRSPYREMIRQHRRTGGRVMEPGDLIVIEGRAYRNTATGFEEVENFLGRKFAQTDSADASSSTDSPFGNAPAPFEQAQMGGGAAPYASAFDMTNAQPGGSADQQAVQDNTQDASSGGDASSQKTSRRGLFGRRKQR